MSYKVHVESGKGKKKGKNKGKNKGEKVAMVESELKKVKKC